MLNKFIGAAAQNNNGLFEEYDQKASTSQSSLNMRSC